MEKKKRVQIILLMFLALLIVITSISGYVFSLKYGGMNLNSGEKYNVNIPFISASGSGEEGNSPIVCGIAQQDNGSLIKNVKIKIALKGESTILGENVTNERGEYCIILPEISSKQEYDVYIEYNDQNLPEITLGSNNYNLDFKNTQNYSRSENDYFLLNGIIENEDAMIEDGRIEIKLGQRVNGTWKYLFGDYRQYYVDINPEEEYILPNNNITILWEIPTNAASGEYKFLVKTSFNGLEKGPISTSSFYLEN